MNLEPAEDIDVAIVVPSRKRPENMPRIMKLLPTAIVTVDESEYDDYAPHVPETQLLPHPPVDGLHGVLNWILENVDREVIVEVDDDLQCVRSQLGGKPIRRPDDILAIVENAARCARDLDAPAFGFSRIANPFAYPVRTQPIRAVSPLCGCFGVLGRGKERFFDTSFPGRVAIDWILNLLWEERAAFVDMRFYWDFGPVFSGTGGNAGLVTQEQFDESTARTFAKWGKYVGGTGRAGTGKKQVPMSIRVSRVNRLAQK